MTEVPSDIPKERRRRYSQHQRSGAPAEPAPVPAAIDTPNPQAASVDQRDKGFAGQLTPEGPWEVALQPPSGMRPGLDLDLGPVMSAARMIREAIANGKVRLADIPDTFTTIATKAMELALDAAREKKMGSFVQLTKLVLEIQRENVNLMNLVREQAKLEQSVRSGLPPEATTPDPEQRKRIDAIVSAQKGAAAPTPVLDAQGEEELLADQDSPMAAIIARAAQEEGEAPPCEGEAN